VKRWLLLAMLGPLAAGCGTPPARDGRSAGSAGEQAEATTTHKCARCHAPPRRLKHTRAELEVAFGRHQARVKLTAEQWQAVVDFLARPDEGLSSK
jgi:hypothetical protein